MNEIYNMKESCVIDEKMLEKAIEEQGPKEQAGCIVKEEVLNYNRVSHLRLDYRHILKIENLWQLTSLTKLQLDNNIIEKIQGIEMLTNLVWLDLSFNKIEVIEGLDTLVKLQDLSLFNNHISVIENMDALQNLQIVSIGNNLIKELENVTYLRKFKNLRTLDLAGNPMCNDNYKFFVAAHLPDLVYLDYRLLDKQTREDAYSQYQSSVEKMKLSDLKDQKVAEVQKKMDDDLQLHEDAFVEYLNGPYLFESLFVDDVEASKLAHLPGVATLLESYPYFAIFEAGLTEHTQRQNEIECFFTCFQKAIADNQQRGAQLITDFERSRRQVMAEMQQAADHNLLKARLKDDIMQIHETLLTLEMQLVAQLEDVMKDFERNIADMVVGFVENVQGIYPFNNNLTNPCRDLENHHHENVLEIAVATLEKAAKNELEEDLPDDVKLLFVDKDMVINAVSASHDIHLLKIDNREDDLLTRINSWKNTLIKTIQDDEVKRNRKRISEIHTYIDFAKDQLEETLLDDYQGTNEN
ncbi:hypothetical protein HF521_004566 [Silurus meridionalis]|uniref:Dynein regulatory complex subunit 3 n=1 Tax=Silurus meridionalis TaxID=175797 RepID=A0A8T0AYL5_SILME|nr:hypothetical protein HF521_004566 [Silurus meridionalis]